MNTKFTLIEDQTTLKKIYEKLSEFKEIGIDLECENNLHHYGSYISLIQISANGENYIVDVLKLKEIKPLIQVLENKKITKIFHDISFDLRILHYQFKCRPLNIFDTQLAALFLGEENIGLGSLLEKYFDVKKVRKFQMADWTKRPLTTEMLTYAFKDTMYLSSLKKALSEKLKKLGRLTWVKEECEIIERDKLTYKETSYEDLKGFKLLKDKEKGIVKELFILRDILAKEVDRPVHFVFSNKKLLELAQNPPKDWRRVKTVDPIVKRNYLTIKKIANERRPLTIEKKVYKRDTQEEKDKLDRLDQTRTKLANKLNLRKHLIMSKKQMQEIVLTKSLESLHNWQRDLLRTVPNQN